MLLQCQQVGGSGRMGRGQRKQQQLPPLHPYPCQGLLQTSTCSVGSCDRVLDSKGTSQCLCAEQQLQEKAASSSPLSFHGGTSALAACGSCQWPYGSGPHGQGLQQAGLLSFPLLRRRRAERRSPHGHCPLPHPARAAPGQMTPRYAGLSHTGPLTLMCCGGEPC